MLPLLLGDRSAQSISGTAEADGNVLNGDADDDGDFGVDKPLER